jgi:5-methylcytosine-specific restriction endonuclease McrA
MSDYPKTALQYCIDVTSGKIPAVKYCSKCGNARPHSEFKKNKGHKDGLESSCRDCLKEYNKIYRFANKERMSYLSRQWKIKNKEKHLAGSKAWRENNPERQKENTERWRKNNPDKVKAIKKRWYMRNPEKVRMNTRITGARLRATPSGKLKRNMGMMMYQSLKGRKMGRHWENLVGYNIEKLKLHLENLFKPGMLWENYGKGGWEVDHIIPVASFDFDCEDNIKKCWALNNLQPLWSRENKIKGKKVYAERL